MLLLCALIVGSSSVVWGQSESSYTITFQDTGTGDDASTKLDLVSDIVDEGADYIDEITNATNVYKGRSGRGLKLGTSKAIGQLTFTLAETVKPTKIVVKARKYNDKGENYISINGNEFTLSNSAGEDCTINYDGNTEVSQIDIETTTTDKKYRTYVISVTIYTANEDVTDTRKDAELSFGTPSYEITLGDSFTAPTLSNPNNLTVSYSSNNSDVAEVNATTGVVTVKAVGSATITASFAGNDEYKPGSASYTLTVNKAPGVVVDGVFDFTYEDLLDYGTGLQPSTDDIKEAKTFTAGNITLTPEPTANNKYWRWWTDGTLRLYTDTKMTIAAPDGYVITKIEFVGTQNLDAITVSGGDYTAASDKKSATWTGAEQSIVFTRNGSNPFFTKVTVSYTESTVSATITDAGYATFSNENALDFSANEALKVYTATDNGTSVKLNEVTTKKVPANTPVVLKGVAGNYPARIISSADALGANDLCISDGTSATAEANIYVLANKTSNGVGFYKWAGDGSLSAGKIYLQAKASSTGAPFLGFDADGETTGISSLTPALSQGEGVYYDLSGRRVAQPIKGLYIVNGKKVLVP